MVFQARPTFNWNLLIIPIGLAVIATLVRLQYGPLLFHTLIELFCVMVGTLMLVVLWQTNEYAKSSFMLYLGFGYFCIGILDSQHLITYPGMSPEITSPDLTIAFWLMARITEALILFTAPFLLTRQLNGGLIIFGYIALISVLSVAGYQVPADLLFVEGEGLTQLKVNLEYIAIAIVALAIPVYIRNAHLLSRVVLVQLFASMVLTIVAELAFTLYVAVNDMVTVIGHLIKMISFWMIFGAIIESNFRRPLAQMASGSNSYDAIPHSAVLTDQNGIIRHMNRSAINTLDIPENEVKNQHVHEYFHPQNFSPLQCPICQAVVDNSPFDDQLFEFEQDKSWKLISLTSIVANDSVMGYIQVNTDVTNDVLSQQKLRESEQLLSSVLETSKDWIFIKDRNFRYIYANEAFAKALDKLPVEVIGRSDEELGFSNTHIFGNEEKNIRGFRVDDNKVLSGVSVHNPFDPAEDSKGVLHIFDTWKMPWVDSDGEIQGVIAVARDVTDRVEMEERLRQSNIAFDSISEGIFICDSEYNIQVVNKAFMEATGYSDSEVIGRKPTFLKLHKEKSMHYGELIEHLNLTADWSGEVLIRKKNGSNFPCLANIAEVVSSSGKVVSYVVSFSDISVIKESEESLRYMAHHDALTELPNRTFLIQHLELAMKRANRHKSKVALLFLDLDKFKMINDRFGHTYGDEVLKVIASRLRDALRQEDLVARQGGDEFLVVLESLDRRTQAAVVAHNLLNNIAIPLDIQNQQMYLNGSIGISIFPDDALTSEQMIKNADTAMYKAKQIGFGQFQYFTGELDHEIRKRYFLESQLHEALQNDELYVAFQPQIDVVNNAVLGVEALVRWQSPKLGFVSPTEFIPVAESIGLINRISDVVLEKSLNELKRWESKFPDMKLSINLSSRQFESPQFFDSLNRMLIAKNVSPERITFEITESVLLKDETMILKNLELLSSMGVQLALDDFGTGYSALSYLKKFQVHTLKIDRSFVKDVNEVERGAVLVRTIIAMAKGLELDVIAEGVESKEQLEFLVNEGCSYIQGYFFSRPLPANEFWDWLLAWDQDIQAYGFH